MDFETCCFSEILFEIEWKTVRKDELDGRQLIKTALIKEPKNIFLQMLEKGTGSLSKYTSWKKQNSKGLEEYSEANFSGSTLFDEYFAEIIKSRNGK
ncbi:hypothetical protein HB852_10855 [Listeria grandensis]|uniref:hypothetical protein n=1 Tax=Listeria grandensis TaxID=1494963 RepID=UPI001626E520|nr:hypothetical protein [Listeria grandensis]MBC1475117.1 hypothetical protein [Listeria grandensis]